VNPDLVNRDVHLIAATLGFSGLAILWLSVVFGVFLRGGWTFTRIRYTTLHKTHHILTLLGLSLSVEHALVQLVAPGRNNVQVIDLWLPFANPHDPTGIGDGVLALEAMLVLVVSVLIQRRLGYHRWKVLHLLAYVAFALLLGHVVISGSDMSRLGSTAVLIGGGVTLFLRLATAPVVAHVPQVVSRWVSTWLRARQVTVNVDMGRCARLGFCEHAAPDLFRLRTDGRLSYKSEVSGAQLEAAVQAARTCPTRAIMLSRLPTTVVSGMHLEISSNTSRRGEVGYRRAASK